MKKICLALILAFTVPAALAGAEENDAREAAVIPQEDVRESTEPLMMAAGSTENARVTTFQYHRQTPAEKENITSEEAEPRQLQRSRSRPTVETYGRQETTPPTERRRTGSTGAATEEPREIKRGLSSPKVTTFQYQQPAPAAPAERVEEARQPEPAPKASSKRTRAARPAAKKAEPQPAAAAPAAEPQPEEERLRTTPKTEIKYTTLNQRTEELDMAKPETASPKGRAARVRTARSKAEAAPMLATPAFDGTSFNVAGVYVNCPKNREETCGEANAEFRAAFPQDQTAPYIMIRKDGRGYVAPDHKRTFDFVWQFLGDNALLIIMEDSKHRKIEYRTEGRYLRNVSTGELFYLSLTDAEWNVEPEPYSKIKARREKAKK